MARSQKEADYSFQLATQGVSSIDDLCDDCLGCGNEEEDQCDLETVKSLTKAETAFEAV